jgi:hypothetical protein
MKRTLSMALFAGAVLTAVATPAQAAGCAATATSEAVALKVAAICKSKVEIVSETTATKQVFANPDGTRTLVASVVPQRVRKDGAWKNIDTGLRQGKDGRLSPRAGAEVSFSNGGNGPFAVSIVDGKRFELSWPGQLATPKVDGNTATYPEVLPGMDLAVSATREGFTHVLVVKTAEAAASPALAKIRYRVSGDLSVRQNAQNDLELVDAAGKAMPLGSHAPGMWDATGGSTVSGASELAQMRAVGTQAEGDSLYLIPDAQLLKTGTLPLFIDPVWAPMASTWVYANNANANWTPGEHARVGRSPDDGKIFRSFFTFPIAGLAGKQVLAASMRITLDHNYACAGNTAFAYRVPVQSGAAGSRVAWSPMLQTQLGSAWGQSNEAGGCGADQGDDLLNFASGIFTSDVQAAANMATGNYSVGLCMCTNSSGAGESGIPSG